MRFREKFLQLAKINMLGGQSAGKPCMHAVLLTSSIFSFITAHAIPLYVAARPGRQAPMPLTARLPAPTFLALSFFFPLPSSTLCCLASKTRPRTKPFSSTPPSCCGERPSAAALACPAADTSPRTTAVDEKSHPLPPPPAAAE